MQNLPIKASSSGTIVNGCPACGYGATTKLSLVGSAGTLSTSIDLSFGKSLAKKVCGDESRFMDDIQCLIKLRDDEWRIKPYPRTKNQMFLNGSPLEVESVLSDGDRLSLKDKAAFMNVSII